MTKHKLISEQLEASGLNMHEVFDLHTLPTELIDQLQKAHPDFKDYKQLILVAHGGRQLWERICNEYTDDELISTVDPIDNYSVKHISEFCKNSDHVKDFKIIYPSNEPIGLQSLGQQAGWHHSSPFMVGINQDWGSWFAYRAAILADSDFSATVRNEDHPNSPSPCSSCTSKPCIKACPANAMTNDSFSLKSCVSYRKTEHSLCNDRCLARMACPVGKEHQYADQQMAYHYGVSLRMIRALGL